MMREIFKEKRQPLCGVCTHPKVDKPLMNFSVDLNLIPLWLGGDRLPRPPSTVLCDFLLKRAHVDELVASSSPFLLLNFAVHL